MNKVVIIDGNNFYYRGFFAAKNSGKEPLDFLLKMFCDVKETYPDARFIFAFDTCKSERRLKLYPDYKGHRKSKSSMTEEEYRDFISLLSTFQDIFRNAGYTVLEGGGYEADDHIAGLVSMVRLNYIVYIISTDGDFLQLVGPNVRVYDPFKRLVINEDRFLHVVGVKREQYLDCKAIMGDDSDNIEGYPQVAKKVGPKLISKHGNFEKLHLYAQQDIKMPKTEKQMQDRSIYDRNKELMDLSIPMKDATLKELVKKMVHVTAKNRDNLHIILTQRNASHWLKRIEHEKTKAAA